MQGKTGFRRHQRHHQARQAAAVGVAVAVAVVVALGCRHRYGLWVKPRLADGGQRLRDHLGGRIDAQGACAQLKTQAADAGDGLQCLADFGLFGAAVHGGDTEQVFTFGQRCDGDVGDGISRMATAVHVLVGVGVFFWGRMCLCVVVCVWHGYD